MVILFLAQIAATLAFIIYSLQLPPTPQPVIIDPISLALLSLIGLLCIPSVIKTWQQQQSSARWNSVLVYLICIIVIFVALLTTYPAYKTRAEAVSYNALLQNAAEYGAQVGQAVREDASPNRRIRQVVPSIPAEYQNDPIVEKVLERAFSLAQATDSAEEISEVVKSANPTIPLLDNQWSCTSIGCAYTTSDFVWTSATQNRAVGAIALVVSTAVAVLSANESTLRLLRRRGQPA